MQKIVMSNEFWTPSPTLIENANITQYISWLKSTYALDFEGYQPLWEWSVANPALFWESVWKYFEVKSYAPYAEVLSGDPMPHARWFEGATLNYAEHIFLKRPKESGAVAIYHKTENTELQTLTWEELERKVAALQQYFIQIGVVKGDRVAAYVSNIPEATVAFLAAVSLGAIWSSCSPDFGVASVLDRFRQIEPKILIAVDAYQYGGKECSRTAEIDQIAEAIPEIKQVIVVSKKSRPETETETRNSVSWEETVASPVLKLHFEPLPFAHPVWILFSSGTTGKPKAITHSHGGVLLEHYKYLAFHNDVKPGERFFWYSTTGWMMWNYTNAALLLGASIVLYDGSPAFLDISALWKLAEDAKINHFGTSAPFIIASMKAGEAPGTWFNLSALRSVSSTGSPLPPEGFAYIKNHVKEDVWLVSMSGGTDVCTAFVGGVPILPVYEGEIQCRALGCDLDAFNDLGESVREEVGEMVVKKPMPSMPVFFWNDPSGEKYRSSYFDTFPGVWRHGDWVKITERNTLIIYGRSDATLNRQGVRIGTAEIYRALDQIPEIIDSLIVNLELPRGEHFMPLFVMTAPDAALDGTLKNKIRQTLKTLCSPRHVPDAIVAVPDIPYTISGKKMETPVKKILMGTPLAQAANLGAMRNPESIRFFVDYRM